MPQVVLGVTGCIGAYKACEVLRELQKREVEVRVVMTRNATEFVSPMTFAALSRHPVFVEQFHLGDQGEIRHISLADWAELLLVAPATANVIAKFARGLADDALSTLHLATRAPLLLAPAMNVNMFEHPAVVENLAILRARGANVVEPGSGYLACGWLGKGRLAEVPEIVGATLAALARRRDLDGWKVVVSAGPTIEDLDPVRFISNRSSGKMGYRVAEAARDRGAQVTLVSGPTALPDPAGLRTVRVRSAAEMDAAVRREAESADVVVMAAAIADWRPASRAAHKVKKEAASRTLDLERTADVLSALGRDKRGRFLVGFAAETDDVVTYARGKLIAKNADLIVANDVSSSGVGFDADDNAATFVDREGERVVERTSKRALAEKLWDRVRELRGPRS